MGGSYGGFIVLACLFGWTPFTLVALGLDVGDVLGNPLLRWQAGNVIVETDAAGNRKPSKAKSLDRIDGIVAPGVTVNPVDNSFDNPALKPSARRRIP